MDPALWALLISSAVLAVLWYRNRPEPAQSTAPNEWTLTPAETVIPSSGRNQ